MKTGIIPFRSIWERYFFREMAKVFVLFLLCIYGLYALIDFSSHANSYHRHQTSFDWGKLALYYLCDFFQQMDVLVPFALLVATIKTVCTLNKHNELIALLAGGVKLKTLLRPFVLMGLFCTGLIYINSEWFLPHSQGLMRRIEEERNMQKAALRHVSTVHQVLLADNSVLVYHHFDTAHQQFFDAYWIPDIHEVYHFKYLQPYEPIPVGQFVDYFKRLPNGDIMLQASYASKLFPELSFNVNLLKSTLIVPEDMSLSELWEKIPFYGDPQTEKEAQIVSVFYYKAIMPWLCFLAVIAPLPFCVRSTRQLPLFFIYAGAIFGLTAFYLILDAALILAKRQAVSPAWALSIPFALFFAIFYGRYARLKHT